MPDFAISKPGPLRPEGLPGQAVASGRVPGASHVHKFGANLVIPTTFKPVTRGGIYPTVQVSGALTMRVKAGNTNDTAAGTGARSVTIVGLDETGAEVSETVATAGTSASSATTATFIRVYRAFVATAGTYASVSGATSGSHAADIVIEDGGGAGDWCTIPLNTFGMAQTTIGAYSVPLGKTAYVESIVLQADSTKAVTFMFFIRENILQAAPPYSALRMQFGGFGIADREKLDPIIPLGPYAALTDLIFMAKVGATTGTGSVDFEMYLEDA